MDRVGGNCFEFFKFLPVCGKVDGRRKEGGL